MSLYNGLFGYDPLVGIVLTALRVDPETLPRFRDAFFLAEPFELMILTRTGGVNRADFVEENEGLRRLPGFLRDQDQGFDSTYAYWFYAVPEDLTEGFQVAKNQGLGRQPLPEERWRKLFADMASKADTPDTRRAVEYGERVIKPQIEGALDSDGKGPVIRIIET